MDISEDRQPPMAVDSRPDIANFKFTFEHCNSSTGQSFRIEPDDNPSPSNETLDSFSVTSSIYRYREENGRTYHGFRDGSYHYPNDAQEQDRLEWQFICLKEVLSQRNYLSPWSQENPPRRILEVGTGTGIWALEMATEFPDAEIIGTDLSPVQPQYVPDNVQFLIEDALSDEGWDWPQKFDHIHIRMGLGCWEDFERNVAHNAYRNLEPGGWFEVQELLPSMHCDDGTMPEDWPPKRLFEDLSDCAEIAKRPLMFAPTIKQALINAGFVDVSEKTYKLPVNRWPKERKWKTLGEMWHAAFEGGGWQAFAMAPLTRIRGLKQEQVEMHILGIRKALKDTSVHAYQKFYVVTGRKPKDWEIPPSRMGFKPK
ncbi:S-adenosyl-L-methionine-dependent methyltransferase [Microdochium bolleyi]|uniref:S-adenosyl-L-methionine-dependent methyltransferase n=1 Tax=Microdochium bolleyi TaxID=196109 RepID=A0A136J166_9PEZI|nr:S-adenosyl-L-methionine-dependent methyltransferase [Microdochium bolleyi]